jgi:hypothetical protein
MPNMVAHDTAQQSRPMKAFIVEFTKCIAAADRARAQKAPTDHIAAAQRMQDLLLQILSIVENETSKSPLHFNTVSSNVSPGLISRQRAFGRLLGPLSQLLLLLLLTLPSLEAFLDMTARSVDCIHIICWLFLFLQRQSGPFTRASR